ncbi:LacI family DNA-binding transcriptional regulator [Streptomyces sp. NPDC088746]|uniref:LacI family DNA-binding transcriptional regulator n=1 Tax=Streptomyces sp. NPDC088746 TaxID=3365885 RepID=UPI0038269603
MRPPGGITGGSASGPTLAVVAREACVSVPTASKVVNGREDVAPDTRRRVTEALDRLGYVRRVRFDAGRRPALVDLMVHSLDSSWSGAVLHGAEAAAHEVGWDVVVSAGLTRSAAGRPERGTLDRIGTRGSSGVLFNLADLTDSQYAWLDQRGIPFVMIDPVLEPPPGVYTVGAENLRGGLAATGHLLALGHERIAVIGGYRRKRCSSARVAGHHAALAAAGIPRRPEYVRYGHFAASGARSAMLELLDLTVPPTAVFVCSDAMALGVYAAVAERGLRVPQDISVVGFDDLPEARWVSPALTTVRQPLSAMGAAGLRLLVRLVEGEAPTNARIELPTELVVRRSTAPPPPVG